MATLYNTDGTTEPIVPANGVNFHYKEIQWYVEGYIELVMLEDGRYMYINEEGKLNGMEYNEAATELFLKGREYAVLFDVIVGPALVMTYKESEGEDE